MSEKLRFFRGSRIPSFSQKTMRYCAKLWCCDTGEIWQQNGATSLSGKPANTSLRRNSRAAALSQHLAVDERLKRNVTFSCWFNQPPLKYRAPSKTKMATPGIIKWNGTKMPKIQRRGYYEIHDF